MRVAILTAGEPAYVENLIVLPEGQLEAFGAAIGKELVEAAPMGLEIGDKRWLGRWTRSVSGEEVELPLLKIPTESAAVEEALRILRGEEA